MTFGDKFIADNSLAGNYGLPLFDNPLLKEFIHKESLAKVLGVSKKWIGLKQSEGLLRGYQLTKTVTLFYIPEVREAILAGLLAPVRRESHDNQKTKNQGWKSEIPGSNQNRRKPNLQDLRHHKASL